MEYTYMEYKKMQNIQTIIFIMVLKKMKLISNILIQKYIIN